MNSADVCRSRNPVPARVCSVAPPCRPTPRSLQSVLGRVSLRAVTIAHDDVAIATGDVAACSACCPAEALRVVTIDHDDVAIATGDGAACAAGAELDLEAKEPM